MTDSLNILRDDNIADELYYDIIADEQQPEQNPNNNQAILRLTICSSSIILSLALTNFRALNVPYVGA